MNVVNAVWEKRNIGVDTVEVTIEETDDVQTIKDTLNNLEVEYIVVKVPSSRSDVLFLVQNMGYYYIEDMISVVHNLHDVCLPPIQKRLYDAIEIGVMDDNDINILYDEIRKGLFDSDRVFLDPFFSKEQARNRYINWVMDEAKRGTELLKYVYKGKTIGFFGLREQRNGEFISFLGGIYLESRKGGIGSIVKVPQAVRERGGKKVRTSVSTNNPAQVRSLIMNGYIPESIIHTFIKHSKGEKK